MKLLNFFWYFSVTTIKCSKRLSESNDGVVPWMNCPQLHDKELASQAGLIPFGGIRLHAVKVQDKVKGTIINSEQ